MNIDMQNVAIFLAPLVQVAIVTAIGVVVPAVLNRLGQANNTALKENLENVLQSAAGGAYKFALAHQGGLSSVAVHNAALASAMAYVVASIPETLKKLNITPERVQQMVSNRLGALLAGDPTVTAGAPPLAPPAPAPLPAPLPPAPPAAATAAA